MSRNDLFNWAVTNQITHFSQSFTDFTFYRQNEHSGFWQFMNAFYDDIAQVWKFIIPQFEVISQLPNDPSIKRLVQFI